MSRNRAGFRRQEGVVLMIALIVLVAMTLAGLGLIRSIDTGNLVAGNIGFRESATASADTGIEVARKWLLDNRDTLTNDQVAFGYYATRQDNLDITGNATAGGTDGVDWDGTDPTQAVKAFDAGTGLDGTANHIYYLIQRMCSKPGDQNAANQSCTTATVTGLGSTQGAPDYAGHGLTFNEEVYYRVTMKVVGAKATASFIQAIVLM